jgi:hypothetical protein
MLERLKLYDLLSALVPGALLLCVLVLLFPDVAVPIRSAGLPSEFSLVALLAASLLAGEVVQTIGSILEPTLFRVSGGRPSDRALDGKLSTRYFPRDAAQRIKEKLQRRVGPGASDRSLFLAAMNLSESTEESKVATFNAQYGHHRAVTTLFLCTLVMLFGSRKWGAGATWNCTSYWAIATACAVLLVLFAWRTWQRGVYYSREVLLTAERMLNQTAASNATGPMGTAQTTPKE